MVGDANNVASAAGCEFHLALIAICGYRALVHSYAPATKPTLTSFSTITTTNTDGGGIITLAFTFAE